MLTVVMGAPCSGKTTYIDQHANTGDIIIDLDRMALAMTTSDIAHHDYPDAVRWVAVAARRAAIESAFTYHHDGASVWIIDTMPDRARRQQYHKHNADMITLDPGRDVCLARAMQHRPAYALDVIDKWYGETSRGRPSAGTPTPTPVVSSRRW